jgi:hypothetical protein
MSDFLPTPEGAEAVIRAARRRRAAKAASASGSSALVVVVALLLTAGGTSPHGHPDQLSTTSGPTPAASSAAPMRASLAPSPTGQRAQAGGPAPSVFPSEVPPRQTPPPALHRTTQARRSPITRTTGSIVATDLCTDGQTDQSRTWCARAFDPGEIKRGTIVKLGGELCNYPTSEPLTLQFADTAQVQISVDPYQNQEKWHGGEGYTYTKPGPTATIAPGQCLQWRSPWDTRDHEGFVVPPGTYELNFYVNTKVEPGFIAFRTITVVD